MSRFCSRPGCSEPGAVAYGMVAQDLLFWVAPLDAAHPHDEPVLCRRHADAMVVPRGWTLDDRREAVPRLFRPPAPSPEPVPPARSPRRSRRADRRAGGDEVDPEQLELAAHEAVDQTPGEPVGSWAPVFDTDDDLDGLLEVRSPLLARAFRGADRPRR